MISLLRTSTEEISARIRRKPRFGLNEHRKVARVHYAVERIFGQSVCYYRIEFDDPKLLASYVFI
jgi:hypothetical protein